MNISMIDKAFYDLIHEKGIDKKLGIESNYVYQLRNKLKNDIGISMDVKLELLQKGGWKGNEAQFTRKDLVSLLNFYKSTSQSARDKGPEYVIEKWLASKKWSCHY